MNAGVIRQMVMASAVCLAVGIAAVPTATRAQEASATPAMQMAEEGHPAHIHAGTCATLGGIDYPLTNLVAPDMMGTPEAGSARDDADATPMAGTDTAMKDIESESTTKVDAPLDEILSQTRAINVHLSVPKIDVYIACGDLPSTAENGKVRIKLDAQNASGLEGWAKLMDNGDGTTTVHARLTHASGLMGTPEGTPASKRKEMMPPLRLPRRMKSWLGTKRVSVRQDYRSAGFVAGGDGS